MAWGGVKNIFLSQESSSGLELRFPAKFQPPERIASGVWILSRLGGWVVKSKNYANSAGLSCASQFELSLAKIEVVLILSRLGGWLVQSDNKANSVQLLLKLPTGTELGKILTSRLKSNLSTFDSLHKNSKRLIKMENL